MFFLARKNLLAEKIRLLISVGGVAFSVLLVVVGGGLYRGWGSRVTDYIERNDADLWGGQGGGGWDRRAPAICLIASRLSPPGWVPRSKRPRGWIRPKSLSAKEFASNTTARRPPSGLSVSTRPPENTALSRWLQGLTRLKMERLLSIGLLLD